ncbi:MarR family winged helix-turn-helix transcriptional regulator [Sphingobium aromaticiconvertens]|uniref:MarR family winged helix-turn-helix transcriptional regulator n=1 Tax=Sphingobium aromaticiconvertens TaxID=365341 RepID=UPI003017DB25
MSDPFTCPQDDAAFVSRRRRYDGGVMGNAGSDISVKEPVDLMRNASMKLAIIARQLRSHFDQSVVRLGVTRSQWTVIAAVARYPGATQRMVADMLEITEVSAGRLIDRLCADGLVERRPRDDDRRAHAVFLTDAGQSITSKLSAIARANEEVAFAGFEIEDMARLNVLLDMISDNISKP